MIWMESGSRVDWMRVETIQIGFMQGCPLSPYIFIICAELLACMIRQNEEIEGITINDNKYLISQYADDTNIFIKYSGRKFKKNYRFI